MRVGGEADEGMWGSVSSHSALTELTFKAGSDNSEKKYDHEQLEREVQDLLTEYHSYADDHRDHDDGNDGTILCTKVCVHLGRLLVVTHGIPFTERRGRVEPETIDNQVDAVRSVVYRVLVWPLRVIGS